MPFLHLLVALAVVCIWGLNFIFVKLALDELSPLVLCALRFICASFPAIFFVSRPTIPLTMLVSYGLVMFALQFCFFFIGMHLGIPPGLASLIVQVQVFFSLFFTAYFLKEKPLPIQIVASLIAFSGIAVVGFHCDKNISFAGFVFILAAAATWGLGNLIIKKGKAFSFMGLVVWGSFVASIPLTLLAVSIDGTKSIANQLSHMNWLGAISVAYIVYGSTWIGYSLWNWLISRYPVNTVVPYTLLIPIVALISSVLLFNEPLEKWKILAIILVLSGICIHFISSRLLLLRQNKALSSTSN